MPHQTEQSCWRWWANNTQPLQTYILQLIHSYGICPWALPITNVGVFLITLRVHCITAPSKTQLHKPGVFCVAWSVCRTDGIRPLETKPQNQVPRKENKNSLQFPKNSSSQQLYSDFLRILQSTPHLSHGQQGGICPPIAKWCHLCWAGVFQKKQLPKYEQKRY